MRPAVRNVSLRVPYDNYPRWPHFTSSSWYFQYNQVYSVYKTTLVYLKKQKQAENTCQFIQNPENT